MMHAIPVFLLMYWYRSSTVLYRKQQEQLGDVLSFYSLFRVCVEVGRGRAITHVAPFSWDLLLSVSL